MTQAVTEILNKVTHLSAPERADLADRLIETLASEISPEIERAQVAEVQRRIRQVDAGEVALIPGEHALEHVRRIVASARGAT